MNKVVWAATICAIFTTSGFAAPVKKPVSKAGPPGLRVPALECDITDALYSVPLSRGVNLGFYFGDDGKPVLIVKMKDRQSRYILRENGGSLTATHSEDVLLADGHDPIVAKSARPFSFTALTNSNVDGVRTWTSLPDRSSAPPGVIFIPELGASLYGKSASAMPPLTGFCMDSSGADDR
jgi:hypothetical protein